MGGNLIEGDSQIGDQVVAFFSNLFQADSVIPEEGLFDLEGPSVTEEQD